MTNGIINFDDVIDIRDVIARVQHLRSLRTPGPVNLGDDNDTDHDTLFAELADLEGLLEVLASPSGDEEWEGAWYPAGLIVDSYFVEAMELLCTEVRGVPKDIPPYIVIDWESTAENLRTNYTPIEFKGVTYWYL